MKTFLFCVFQWAQLYWCQSDKILRVDHRKSIFWAHFSWFSVPSAHTLRASKIEFYLKLRVFNIFLRFFFSAKAEMLLFPKMKKGEQKGDHQRLYFGLKNHVFFENFKKIPNILTKIQPRVVPPLIPLFHFWKKRHLSYHWKKKS